VQAQQYASGIRGHSSLGTQEPTQETWRRVGCKVLGSVEEVEKVPMTARGEQSAKRESADGLDQQRETENVDAWTRGEGEDNARQTDIHPDASTDWGRVEHL
jgi:hypothetical protein